MRSLFAAFAVLAVSAPALAQDVMRDLAKDPGAQVVPPKANREVKPVKLQDRISHDAPLRFAGLPVMSAAPAARSAYAWGSSLDAAIVRHAAANGVPIELARRVVKRESGGNARAVSKGNYGLMQIRLGTAKAMGYSGNAKGLLNPETNMTYAMRYLAGAYRAAKGNHDRAVALYARGYYHEAKRMGFSPYDPPRAASINAMAVR